jgi:D-alanyl-D-alanine carboxypeptidase/D-alanyl-D-alanine-endopeptidase (penicillin-binding protein 4)
MFAPGALMLINASRETARRPRRFTVHIVCFGLAAAILNVADLRAGDALPTRLEAVINSADYKHAHWGLYMVDQATGETVYEHNVDKLFAPASTTKLYSVATALAVLGPDFRFETPVYRRGEVGSGVLNGDLILVASGDLTLGGRTDEQGRIAFKDNDHTYANGNNKGELTAPDPLAGIKDLARQVAAAGIERVRGDVLVDDRLFDKATSTGSGPGQITPILVNDNLIDIVVTPGEAGAPAMVTWRPETAAFQVDGRVETIRPGEETSITVRSSAGNRIVVRGRIPAGRQPILRVVEVDSPATFARTLLIEALNAAGVTVDASPLEKSATEQLPPRDTYSSLSRVATLKSPPFSENATLILKVSHNLHASTLPLLVAVQKGLRTEAEGLRLQHDFLELAGIDADTISFGGGAGGSRADYTTPRTTVQLLKYMAQHPAAEVYRRALPVLGLDGTLATAVDSSSPAKGKVRAKTGTLFWQNTMNNRPLLTSKALAGYLESSKGRQLIFAFFVNNTHLEKADDTAKVGRTLGKLCEIVHEEL